MKRYLEWLPLKQGNLNRRSRLLTLQEQSRQLLKQLIDASDSTTTALSDVATQNYRQAVTSVLILSVISVVFAMAMGLWPRNCAIYAAAISCRSPAGPILI